MAKSKGNGKDKIKDLMTDNKRLIKENEILLRDANKQNFTSMKTRLGRLNVFSSIVLNILASNGSSDDKIARVEKAAEDELKWI